MSQPPLGDDDPRTDAEPGKPAYSRTKMALICAWCRKVHMPDGTWQPGRRATDATVENHGICPDCSQRDDLKA